MDSAPKYRELAYKVWCENGQHIQKTVAALNKDHAFDITRQSLANWRDEYDWEGRAARAEAAERERAAAVSDSVILDSLISQKQKYEAYFESLKPGQIDTQAVYGYNSILKTILDIKDKIAARRKEGEKDGQVGLISGRVIKTPQDAILALQDAIENKINIMLVQPDSVTPKGVNDLLNTLDKVDQMKAKHSPKDESGKRKGMSQPTVEGMKARLLGLMT